MSDKAPEAFDRLLNDLPVGQADVARLVRTGRSAKRRRRTAVFGATAAAVLAVAVGTAAAQTLLPLGSDDDQIAAKPERVAYGINVTTVLSPESVFFEGALIEVTLTKAGNDQPIDPYLPAPAPWTRSWNNLPPGEYVISGAIRVCGGNCGYLAPPTDGCQQTVALDRHTAVRIDFTQNQPCAMTISADKRPDAGQANPMPIDLPTNDWEEGDLAHLALIAGTLSVDPNNCLYLKNGASRTYALWPKGYTATIDSARHATVYNADGAPVARDGDTLGMGGGYGPGTVDHSCLPREFGETASIMTALEPPTD